MKILVTGAAGFIGMHLTIRLLNQGHEVVGLDNLNDYYDVNLKKARIEFIGSTNQFSFLKIDLAECDQINAVFLEFRPDVVINLAAQAGVRYSLQQPRSYIDSNIVGFTNILEACRHMDVKHLIYASSSSIYGLNEEMPYHEGQNVDHPLALYGATKRANELLSHSYSYLFGLPATGLRFFTVYGPWGRPDMALFKFTSSIIDNKPIDVYNHGQMIRDFTYIDDVVEVISRLVHKPAVQDERFDAAAPDAGTSSAPWRIFNIGNGKPTRLLDYISALEKALDKKAEMNFMEMQPGDVESTSADNKRLEEYLGFKPDTPIQIGIQKFVDWYVSFYQTKLKSFNT